MYLQKHTLKTFKLREAQGGEIKSHNLHQSECICVLPCKYLHTFLFPPHASHGMLSFSTCCLIPLLTAGQQVNWYPPPCRRQGSTLMKLRLGLCFGWQHTRGNDILGSPGPPHLAASIFSWLLTHADQAQSIQRSPAGNKPHRFTVSRYKREYEHIHTNVWCL